MSETWINVNDVPPLQIGDVFKITNDDTPWFARGLFKVVSIVKGSVDLERVGSPEQSVMTNPDDNALVEAVAHAILERMDLKDALDWEAAIKYAEVAIATIRQQEANGVGNCQSITNL